MKYFGPLIIVEEITRSRKFYEELLGQHVDIDFGVNVSFKGDFSIHLKEHYQSLLGDKEQFPIAQKTHNFELYFETKDLPDTAQRLKDAGVKYVHEIREQPWAQRVLRVYDPDDHIVEIGETMEAVVIRLCQAGMTAEQASQRTGMPLEFVRHAAEAANL